MGWGGAGLKGRLLAGKNAAGDDGQKGDRAMADNLLLGPDAQVNHTIDLLRTIEKTETLGDGVRLAPHAFVALDGQGQVEGSVSTAAGNVLRLQYQVRQKPRWLALHLGLGGIDLTGRTVLGLVCKTQAPVAATFQPCLRSGRPEGFVDAHLPKHVVAYAEASTHVDLLRLEGSPQVPLQAPWRDLVLFFQTTSARIDIQDLRVFIV